MKQTLTMLLLLVSVAINAQNPYLPLWEYIPDGEPYVFEDPDNQGQYRVYIYGSHDSRKIDYCGLEQVVWSASVNDLSSWRYDGVIFTSTKDAEGNLLRQNGSGDILLLLILALPRKRKWQDGLMYFLSQQSVKRTSKHGCPFSKAKWSF